MATTKQKQSNQKRSSPGKGASPKEAAAAGSSGNSLLEKFFVDQVKDIYWAEKALVKALPKMQKAATSQALKDAFATHTQQTKEQITRLEEVFELLGKKAQGKKCEAMEGLLAEAESVIEDTEGETMTRDVGLIISAQKVEHYEIASYGGLAQLARTMGLTDISQIMETTLAEEKETDALLTSIAENDINEEAEEED